MLKAYSDWFWSLFGVDLAVLQGVPLAQLVIDTLPFVVLVCLAIGVFVTVFNLFCPRGEEEDIPGLTGLDKEIAEIRKLQRG